MTLPRDTIVQLIHDAQLRGGLMINEAPAAERSPRSHFTMPAMVEFTADRKTVVIARVDITTSL